MNGEELREDIVQNLEVFEYIIGKIDVLARSRPQDKYTMVTGLKQLGHVVAVTGDGTNDAPALKKADIGFAMGSGTEIARETADIILMDDNFVSIVGAVRWGRNIYDNIQKFIQFQLTVNVVAVCLAVVGAITIQQSPLTATQMLWVNLIMDTMASLALATAPPDDKVLDRAPQARDDAIVTRRMWRNIIGMAFFQMIILFVLIFAGEDILPEYDCDDSSHLCNPNQDGYVRSGRMYTVGGDKDYYDNFKDPNIGPSRHLTYIFNIFVLMQLSNEINSRCLTDELNIFKGLRKNPMFVYIWIFTLGVQALMVQVGSYALSVHVDGLSGQQWGISIAFGLTPLLWRLVLRLIPMNCFRSWGSKEIDIQGEGSGALGLRRDSRSIERRRSSLRT
jgi:Ca2+ transporting ATPase